MASKRRLRRKGCTHKVRHESEAFAKIAAYKTKGRVGAYKCKFCGGWHVGHAPKKVRRAMAEKKYK